MSEVPPVYKGAMLMLQWAQVVQMFLGASAAREALAEHLAETIGQFREEVGDDFEDEDLAWTVIRAIEERMKTMGDMYGPVETMAEQLQKPKCRTFEDPSGTVHTCAAADRAPHPDVACHDGEWVWSE
ncbi:hypothetical protein ACWGLK_31560 [Streptomyces albidoflavus]